MCQYQQESSPLCHQRHCCVGLSYCCCAHSYPERPRVNVNNDHFSVTSSHLYDLGHVLGHPGDHEVLVLAGLLEDVAHGLYQDPGHRGGGQGAQVSDLVLETSADEESLQRSQDSAGAAAKLEQSCRFLKRFDKDKVT